MIFRKSKTRIGHEKRTIRMMIECYCRNQHDGEKENLCPECKELLGYALKRLEHCHWGESKPSCAKCSIHCYKPEKRARIKEVMRYAGPRMLFHHPYLAITHLLDGLVSKNGKRTGNYEN